MDVHRLRTAAICASLLTGAAFVTGCGGGSGQSSTGVTSVAQASLATSSTQAAATTTTARRTAAAASAIPHRAGFVGAFFRPDGAPPYGVFSSEAPQGAPVPYPTPGAIMTGPGGYCDQTATNGMSIDSAYAVSTTKLIDAIDLGARWTRMPASQFFDDLSHINGTYAWGDLDAAQCISYVYHHLKPIVGLEAGPVEYDATPGTFSPQSVPTYQTASDFGSWCGAVAAHEKNVFGVSQFSEPGNEVNTDAATFPGGVAQVAQYAQACYAAIKAANPNAFVYGLELNMDGSLNAPGYVSQLYALGCKVGTCYDGISIHLSLRYPIPAAGTPCYPSAGGDYSMACVTAIQTAAQAPNLHVLIGETVYPVPSYVPDENTQAAAVVAAFSAFAANPSVDGVNYANVDECGLYPTGSYFAGGCLIDTSGNQLPAYGALQWLASQSFL
jgi:hypothetical protein